MVDNSERHVSDVLQERIRDLRQALLQSSDYQQMSSIKSTLKTNEDALSYVSGQSKLPVSRQSSYVD
jgi:cell fate (sporulation/competence/biofilm development) regulator YlbF (YheA/YmcA/DUF963 family)